MNLSPPSRPAEGGVFSCDRLAPITHCTMRALRERLHQMVTLLANCSPKPLPTDGKDGCVSEGDAALAYKMVAERDNETVRVERESTYVIVAKARVWASEGWKVVITDKDGKSYPPEEFDKLLAA